MTEDDRPVVWISHRGGEACVRCGRPVEQGQIILLDRQAGLRCAACGGLGDRVRAHVRHHYTPYDELLAAGREPFEVRPLVRGRIDEVLARWEGALSG